MSKRSKSRDLAIVPNDQTVPVEVAANGEWEPESPAPEPPIDVEFVEAKPEAASCTPIPASCRAKLKELREKQREQMARVEELKQETKEAKAVLELTNARIGQAIDEIDQPDLFDQAAADEPDGWQDVPLSEALAGVPASVIEALAEANLTTVGELADWIAADGGRHRLTDIKGIGEAKAEQIQQALEAFWVRWREAGTAGGGEEDEDES